LIEEKLGPEIFSQLINDQSNEQLWSPLLLATAQKDFELAKYLIDKGARVMQPMSSDVTMLHLAASNGDVRLLDYALA
jgi:ankyrin repeat protein